MKHTTVGIVCDNCQEIWFNKGRPKDYEMGVLKTKIIEGIIWNICEVCGYKKNTGRKPKKIRIPKELNRKEFLKKQLNYQERQLEKLIPASPRYEGDRSILIRTIEETKRAIVRIYPVGGR